jgi:plasmid stabilization system protein ParE
MGWRVTLTEPALADLEELVAFLAKRSPSAAERIGLELVELIFTLHHLPHRGALVRPRPGLRKIAHRHYLVIYRITEATTLVEVVRIWDNRRDPDRLRLP